MQYPTSTYRLQFRDGMTFDKAAGLVPYLQALGISHLYASPIFSAVTGSTHGYDVTDPTRIDPVLGGRDGFERLSRAVQEAGMFLLLDIVPNHMAASLENPWWNDVIEWSHASRHADCFDIDWEQRLTLPFLGEPFEQAAAEGNVAVRADRERGMLTLCYYDSAYPLNPSTYAQVLRDAAGDGPRAALTLATQASADAEEIFHAAMRALLAGPAGAEIDAALADFSSRPEQLSHLHDLQSYRLMDWRLAPKGLAYRRFFEITGLVGVRVEDPKVFESVHASVFELLDQKLIHGLRIDHIDGLADPRAYLDMLRQRIGPETYLIVEKIVEGEESLPPEWPIQGTTGYEFITALNATLASSEGVDALETAYQSLSPRAEPPAEAMRNAKLLMIRVNFEGEVAALGRAIHRLTQQLTDAPPEEAYAKAMEELLVAFPVYRTYGTADGLGPADAALLAEVCAEAAGRLDAADTRALRQIAGLLAEGHGPEAVRFRTRFQQLTGPLMAKALEDTLFYRHNAFLALNEVGGAIKIPGEPLPDFHLSMVRREQEQPLGLSATATHDTKRGEDARARLLTLSEDPESWIAGVERWREMQTGSLATASGAAVPEPDVEWMIFQALAGIWPCIDGDVPIEECHHLEERLHGFLEKAMREAKLASNWSAVDADYEAAVHAYASRLLAEDNTAFRDDFRHTLQPYIRAGNRNSLSQTILKLTAPGIPDIYQGSEQLDLSFVDPDNRRMPDYDALAAALDAMPETGEIAWSEQALASGKIKQQVIRRLLRLRRAEPALFAEGRYHPLAMDGENRAHLLGYLRQHGNRTLVTVVPRLTLAVERAGSTHHGEGRTRVLLPDELLQHRFTDLFTGHSFTFPERDGTVSGFAAEGYSLLLSQDG